MALRHIFTVLIIILINAASQTSPAQRNFPIRATVQYTPPYSLFLGDYATPKLIITLTGQDLLDANCPYKLSISLECQNVKITTKPSYNPAPLYISGGQTIVLTGAELARYFDIQNLDFHGITAAKYLQDGQLPEGFYRMNIKVLNYNDNRQISNTAFVMFNARMGKPPILTLPKNKSLIPPNLQVMPITFSWTPKTVGAYQYRFEIWECAVPDIPVQTVVSTVRPIHTQTTFSPMLTIHPANLNMKPGTEYAWRITVEDPQNQQKFANQGRSEIFTFTYKRKPEGVTGLNFTHRGLRVTWSWEMSPAHSSYHFQYYDPQTGRTIDIPCEYNTFSINLPQTGYHIKARVQAECYNDPTLLSDFTPYLDTYVEPIPVPEYECGKVFPDREITNLELKHSFAPGEIVESKNGDTRYEIIYANENNGYLSGQFFMIMDCWGGAKIRCEFSQTQINTDNIVLKTIFHNVPDSTLYVKPETIRKEIQEAFLDAATVLTDFSIKDTVKLSKSYTYLYITPSGKVMAVTAEKNGQIKSEETDISVNNLKENTLVQGANGEELVITKKGQVMGKEEFNATGGNSVLLKDYHRKSDSLAQWQINFLPDTKHQTYAFDRIGSGDHGIFATDEYYPRSGDYDFRYKSVECGKNDKVEVEFGSYPEADSVVFKDKYGVTYPIKDRILTFTGVSKADTNYIYAYRGDKKIGKLFLNTYQRKTYKVVIVSVNGAKIQNENKLEKYLNEVYSQCAVNFEISKDEIKIDDLKSFSHGGSGILTVYNDDQKKVLNAYDSKMQDNTYYLFFVDGVTDKKDGSGTLVSGYMPRGYNCGFIYDGGSERTIAHELGHGIAGLEHVFENSKASGRTANLMDYSIPETATELWHFQWDQIQDPSRVWMKWNKDESEGEWTTDGHYYLFTYLGMLMNMKYDDAERLGRYAEEPDSHVFSKEDGKTVIMGDNKEVEVFHNYFEEGDFLPAHTASLIGSNDRYYDKKGREIRFATTGLSLYNWGQIPLTAQDIFNGYVDVKDNILEHSPNIKVNDDLNYRLYFKSKTTYMAENTTWVIDELQQRNHALSSGYHGVELAVTAYAIKNAAQLGMKQDVQKYLLHRFGDVFAHFKYDGDEAKTKEELRNSEKYTDRSLSDYISALDYFFTHNIKCNVPKYYPYDGKIIEQDIIYQDGDMFYSPFNEEDTKVQIIRFLLTTRTTIRRYKPIDIEEAIRKADSWYEERDGIERKIEHKSEMSNQRIFNHYRDKLAEEHYLIYYSFPEFQELLLKIINAHANATQNDRVMYGDEVTCMSGWTTGHSDDGTAPDEILRRSELFMLYVKRAAELLNIIRGEKNIQLGVDDAVTTIQSVVEWGIKAANNPNPEIKIDVNARLDGVFSFLIECEKHKNDNEFYVYIPIKFLPKEIDEGLAWLMYSDQFNDRGLFEWDFTRGANNQRGVLERYLSDKGYSVVEPKIVNKVQDDMHNTTPSFIGLKIRKR